MTASASSNRYIDLAISVQVADVERDERDRPRWVPGSHEQLLRIGGRWDRRKKRWRPGPTSKTLPIVFHRGQEAAARWFCDWLTRFVRGDWSNYKRAWSVLLIGGRRSGKTHLACAALVLFAILNKRSIIWAISPTLETGDELDAALKSIAPKSWYVRRQAKTGRSTTFTFANGSRILLKSAVKPERLKAGRVDIALLNEAQELSQKAYVKLRAPIADKGGILLVAANPPETPQGRWVEDYYNQCRAGSIDAVVFELDPERNPWIKHEGLTSMAKEIDDATYQRDVLGLFPPIGDIVFEYWSLKENIRAIPEDWINVTATITKKHFGRAFEQVIGADFQRQPHMCAAVVEFWENPDEPGEVYPWLVDEIVREEADEDDLVTAIEEAGYEPETSAVVMDASAWWQDGAHNRGKKSDQKFRARGWYHLYRPQKDSNRNPEIMVRVNCARALVKAADIPPKDGAPKILGRRRLFSVPENEQINDAMRRWENRNGAPSRSSDFAHLCDAVTYPLFRFFGKARERKKRKLQYRAVGRFDRAEDYPRY